MKDFYDEIEDGVREWVRHLRDAGINTECSCGHEGYIRCQVLDLPADIQRIKDVLHTHGLWYYTIEFHYVAFGENFTGWSESITVRSKEFKANLQRPAVASQAAGE